MHNAHTDFVCAHGFCAQTRILDAQAQCYIRTRILHAHTDSVCAHVLCMHAQFVDVSERCTHGFWMVIFVLACALGICMRTLLEHTDFTHACTMRKRILCTRILDAHAYIRCAHIFGVLTQILDAHGFAHKFCMRTRLCHIYADFA